MRNEKWDMENDSGSRQEIIMTRQSPFVLRSLCLFAFLLFTFSLAAAQSTTATLSGTVTDQNGAVVPAVEITVENIGTALKRHTTTNDEGRFTVPLLPPSTYSITAQRTGFTPVRIAGVVLNVGDQKALKIELKTGDVTAQVQVISEAPLINTSPAVTTTIDRQFVGNLPLNGRSFQSLILLTPGVTVASAGGSDFGQFSVNGQRASTNYFTVDGVSANIGSFSQQLGGGALPALSGAYPAANAFGGTNSLVSVDALEEFKIQSSTYAAEFGRQPGGQVQLITRSGTNHFHGSLFEYFRNEALDARNYFNRKPAPKPPLRQNQFGGTFSGPILKNKTFFFFSYEGLRVRQPASITLFVPSLRVRQAAAASIKPILNSFPIPTGDEERNSSGAFTGWAPAALSFSSPGTMDATSVRIDHTINNKFSFFGRFNESPSKVTAFTGAPFGGSVITSTRTLTFGNTAVLSARLTNEFRINYSRQLGQTSYVPFPFGGAVPLDPKVLTSGNEGDGQAFLRYGGRGIIFDAGDSVVNYQQQINIVNNVSLSKGMHELKFGIDYRKLSPTYGPNAIQTTQFRSEADINAGFATRGTITNFDSARPRFTNFSAYGQDSWKATQRLTFEFGLRWEINPPPTEADGKRPILALGIVGTNVSNAALAPPGTPTYETFKTAFAPRVGLAYLVNQKSGRELVVRGGFGVYYDLGSAGSLNNFPLTASKAFGRVPFPLSAADARRPSIVIPTMVPPPTTLTATANTPALRLPYTLQWNVAGEKSLGTNHVVSIAYVAAIGRDLLTTQFLDSAGFFGQPPQNPNFGGGIQYTFNGSTSDYHSLQAHYNARLSRRLQALVNYTWSHAIDDVSSDAGVGVLSRGNADFDVRHNLSAGIAYNMPSVHFSPVVKYVLSDWTLDGIIHAQSGRPIDVLVGFAVFDTVERQVRPDVVSAVPLYISDPSVAGGRRFNTAAFRIPTTGTQGNFGRNVLRELPLYQLDIALGRTFKLSENWKLQFKAEAFNVFNHPMFSSYDNFFFLGSTTFGVPRATLNSNALSPGAQSSLYQIGGPRSMQLSMRLSF